MKTLIFLIFFGISNLFSQSFPGKYWIELTDKNNCGFNTSNPENFLSQRAIDRRERHSIPIVYTDLPISQIYIDSLEKLGCTIVVKSKWLNAITIATTDTALLDTITNISFIKHIDRFTTKAKYTNSTTSGIKNTDNFYNYGQGYNQIHIHNGEVLHNNNFRGENMLIAILDAGFIDVDIIEGFANLFSDNRIVATKNIVDGSNNVYEFHSHGTMVLSTIATYLPGQFIGTAPQASFALIRTEDASSEFKIEEDFWVAGAEYADSIGADVINSSLGYTTFNDTRQNYSYSDLNGKTARISIAATIAAQKGILVVNSAGNEGNSAWHSIGVPADADSILSVGAVDVNGNYASFSSTGPTSDGRIKPDVSAVGSSSTVLSTSGSIISASGTSFSSPITAGLATCLWQAKPDLTNIELINIITKNSSQFTQPNSLLGYGIPNFANALLYIEQINGYSNSDEFVLTSANPFKNEITFDFFSASNQTIKICLYDILGKEIYNNTKTVYKYSKNSYSLNYLSNLNNGIFILKIYTTNNTKQIKLIKNWL